MGGRLARHRDNYSKHYYPKNRLNEAMIADPNQFEFSVIEETNDREEALSREQFWINFYQSHIPEFGYNTSPSSKSVKGLKFTPERSLAQSINQTGRKIKRNR